MSDGANIVYRYDGTYQGFLCCVAQCFFDKKLPQGVQLLDEPQGTQTKGLPPGWSAP